MAAPAAATNVSPPGSFRQIHSLSRSITTDFIPAEPSVNLGEHALHPSLPLSAPFPFFFQEPGTSTWKNEGCITSERPERYELGPTQWIATQHQVNVPETSLLHPLDQRCTNPAVFPPLTQQGLQVASRHRWQASNSIHTNGTLDARSSGEPYTFTKPFGSIENHINSTDRYHQLHGSSVHGVPGHFPPLVSTNSYKPLPSSELELQARHEVPQTPATHGTRNGDLDVHKPDTPAFSNHVSPHPLPQKTSMPQTTHKTSQYKIEALKTPQTRLSSQNALSIDYSDQAFSFVAYDVKLLQDDV
ncbi:hypothetical protein MMC34_001107 [Xylographa carneopallida]|nr:hypothetical protein [Xylographa carneopallida]